jgi:aldehyde:ferredoxin oxidoreductase
VLQDIQTSMHYISVDAMLRAYYEGRGWDENGVPTEETLDEPGIGE